MQGKEPVPFDFSRLINRFYTRATHIIAEEDGLTDFAALGDEVNLAARIASQAGTGEVLVSRPALEAAGIAGDGLEWRELTLKGIGQPVGAAVLRG